MKQLGPLLHVCSMEKNTCQVIGISSFSLNSFMQVQKPNMLPRSYCNFVILRSKTKYKILDILEDFK